MSQQRDLPESVAWQIIGRLESGKAQRSATESVAVARSIISWLWDHSQETGNVKCQPVS